MSRARLLLAACCLVACGLLVPVAALPVDVARGIHSHRATVVQSDEDGGLVEIVAHGALAHASEDAQLAAALSAVTDERVLPRQQEAADDAVAADAVGEPRVMAQVDATLTASAMMQTFGYAFEPLPPAALPTTVANFCYAPTPKKYAMTFVFKMTCGGDAENKMKVGTECAMQCAEGYVLVGNKYRCEQPSAAVGAIMQGDAECVPSCDPFTRETFSKDPTYTLKRFGSYHALAGGCKVPIGAGEFCDIECLAGQQRIGTRFYCDPNRLQLHGSQQCRDKSQEDINRRAALDANPAEKARIQAQYKADAEAKKSAKGPGRRLFGLSSHAVELTADELTDAQAKQMASGLDALASDSGVDVGAARGVLDGVLDARGSIRSQKIRRSQSTRFARASLAAAMFAPDDKCAWAGCDAMTGVVTASEKNSDLSTQKPFKQYVVGLLKRLGSSAKAFSNNEVPTVYVAFGSTKLNGQTDATGQQAGEVLKKSGPSYIAIQNLIVEAIAAKVKATATAPIVVPSIDLNAELVKPANANNKNMVTDVCRQLPLDPETKYSFFALIMNKDTSLCFVWTAKKTFAVYFQLGALIKSFVPPPFSLLQGGGLALSLDRELRLAEYKSITFGFGTSLAAASKTAPAGHLVVPASCHTSVPAGKKLLGDVMGFAGIGCQGHLWMQLNLEWDPFTSVSTGESILEEGSAFSNAVDQGGEGDRLKLGVEGRATVFLDFHPNPVPVGKLATDDMDTVALNKLEASRDAMDEPVVIVAGQEVSTVVAVDKATGKPENKMMKFLKSTMATMRENGFTGVLDAQMTLKLQANFIAHFELNVDCMARILVQIGTTQTTPLGYSSDGLYIKVGLRAGAAGSTASATGARVTVAKLMAFKDTLRKMYNKVRRTQPGTEVATKPVFADKEFEATAGMDITLQFNGDGFAIAIEAQAQANNGDEQKLTGAGIFFRMGLDGALEFCARHTAAESCSNTKLIVYYRRVTSFVSDATKKVSTLVVDWFSKTAKNSNQAEETNVRTLDRGLFSLVHRLDQDVAHLLYSDAAGVDVTRCVTLLFYMNVRNNIIPLAALPAIEKSLADSKGEVIAKVTKDAKGGDAYRGVNDALGANLWTDATMATNFGALNTENLKKFADQKKAMSNACAGIKAEAACGVVNKNPIAQCSWIKNLILADECVIKKQPQFNPIMQY